MSGHLTLLDLVAVGIYLLATLGLGLWLGRRVQTEEDYFLAGRRLPWWAIGLSLVATDIGATDIIGVGGAAYSYGLAVANFEWIGCVPAMILAAFVFIPFFWRIGVYTIPEYLERRFHAGVRSALAFCWLAFMACNLGIMLLASAKMLSGALGWQASTCIYVTAFVVGVYTIAGGLAAVVYTDAIQCGVMIGGCLLVLLIGLYDIGGLTELRDGLDRIEQRAAAQEKADGGDDAAADSPGPAAIPAAQRTALVLPVDTPSPFPWTGIFFGLALILSPAYWIGNQAIVQRSLGAKSAFEAKAAYVGGAVLKNVIPFVIAVPGLIALVRFPELKDGDLAFPQLVSVLLPAGLRGVFLAAFIAALMSSIDSYLNSAATLLTNDLYRRFIKQDASHRHLMWVGRLITAGLVVWAIVFALFLAGRSEGIYNVFQTLMAFFQGPAFAVLMSGLLWRRATGTAALSGFLCGVSVSVLLFTLNQPAVYAALGWQPLFQVGEPFLYFSVWAFLAALVVVIVVSFLTRPEPPEKLQFLVFAPRPHSRKQEAEL